MTDTQNDPFLLFTQWFEDATKHEPHNPNAMCLASSNSAGEPSARMVLLKEFDSDGFVFYTNTQSQKGKELLENPQAALCFYWKSINKQVRIQGPISLVTNERSDLYFASRPRDSQVGAWASKQSRPMQNKDALKKDVELYQKQFENTEPIKRPDYWCGFLLTPKVIEFWTEKLHRLHERQLFTRKENGSWEIEWLYP